MLNAFSSAIFGRSSSNATFCKRFISVKEHCCFNCYQLISQWNILFVSFLLKEPPPTILFCLGSRVDCDSVAQPTLPPPDGSGHMSRIIRQQQSINVCHWDDTNKHDTVAWLRRIYPFWYIQFLLDDFSSSKIFSFKR